MALPLINLDDKTFEELVKEAKKYIPVYAPHWTDHNLHDPGITLIELFAWLTEMQVYRLNRITKNSRWNFLKLVGINKDDFKNDDEAEALKEAIFHAQRDLKTVYRAVTTEDYEYLALAMETNGQTPQHPVDRVRAIPRYHPNQDKEVPGIVTVVVVPYEPKPPMPPDLTFLKAVYQHLDQYRLLTTELFVIPAHYVEISVKASIEIKPQNLFETVQNRVETALNTFLKPTAENPDEIPWPFGRPVYMSEIYQVIDGVEGVDHVSRVELKKDQGDYKTEDIVIPAHSLVYSGEHSISWEKEEEKNG